MRPSRLLERREIVSVDDYMAALIRRDIAG